MAQKLPIDIVGGTRRGRLVVWVETRISRTRSDNVVAALAATTVTMVWESHRPRDP